MQQLQQITCYVRESFPRTFAVNTERNGLQIFLFSGIPCSFTKRAARYQRELN